MSELSILILLYAVGVLMLVAEIFIPSHGVLSVAALGFLITAVYRTFVIGGKEAGVIAVLACLIFLPTFAFLSIKYWPRTPMGRRIAPPNPTYSANDTSIPLEELSGMVGKPGRALSPLRPVGICEFNGRRISCIAEYGMIEAGAEVVATHVAGSNLGVVSAAKA